MLCNISESLERQEYWRKIKNIKNMKTIKNKKNRKNRKKQT